MEEKFLYLYFLYNDTFININ